MPVCLTPKKIDLSINPPTPQTVSLCSLSLPSAPLPCPTVYQSTRQHHKLSVCALFPSPPPPYPVQLSINQPANTTNCQSVLSFPPLRPLTLSNCLSINPPTPQTVSLCSLSLPSAPLPCPTVYQSTRQHHKLSVCALFPSPPPLYPVQLSINQPANTTNCQSVLSFPPLRPLTLSNCLSINPPTPQTVSLCSLSLPSAPLPCPTVYQSTRQHHKLSVCALFPSPPLPYPVQLSINQPANTTNCQSVLSFPPLRSLTLSNCLSINPPTPQTVSLCSLSLPSAPLPCPTVYQSTRQHHKLSVCALFPSPPLPYPVQLPDCFQFSLGQRRILLDKTSHVIRDLVTQKSVFLCSQLRLFHFLVQEADLILQLEVLFVCLVGFLTSLSTTRLYRGRASRQSV